MTLSYEEFCDRYGYELYSDESYYAYEDYLEGSEEYSIDYSDDESSDY